MIEAAVDIGRPTAAQSLAKCVPTTKDDLMNVRMPDVEVRYGSAPRAGDGAGAAANGARIWAATAVPAGGLVRGIGALGQRQADSADHDGASSTQPAGDGAAGWRACRRALACTRTP